MGGSHELGGARECALILGLHPVCDNNLHGLQALDLLFLSTKPILLHIEFRANGGVELLLVIHALAHSNFRFFSEPEFVGDLPNAIGGFA